MVRPGDGGRGCRINRVGERIVGDADFAGLQSVASAITPVPGGIGPLTICMLLRNTLTAARLGSRKRQCIRRTDLQVQAGRLRMLTQSHALTNAKTSLKDGDT